MPEASGRLSGVPMVAFTLGSAIDTFNDAATPEGWADYPCLGLDQQALYLLEDEDALPVRPARGLHRQGSTSGSGTRTTPT